MKALTIALAKGRIADSALEKFADAGMNFREMMENNRKLVFCDEAANVSFFMAKPVDVPTYVEYGAADVGISGKDTILEERRSICEIADLGFCACKMVVAGFPGALDNIPKNGVLRVATKYPNIAKDYFNIYKKQTVEIIKLNGSVELGPIVGLADVIVDLVETGLTLKENGLDILGDVCDISTRLITNKVSMKLERERIAELASILRAVNSRQRVGSTLTCG